MRSLRLSPKARADLDKIWTHTAETWGLDKADSYLRTLDDGLELLRDNPLIGREASGIKPGYRKLVSGSHVIYYRLGDRAIDVIRILHKSMDAQRHL
jgi:toxin ParE1/3/4